MHTLIIFISLIFRPAANPFDPKGPSAIELFLVLFFREMVADPLATLRDHVKETGKLGPRMAVKNSLKNLGGYQTKAWCRSTALIPDCQSVASRYLDNRCTVQYWHSPKISRTCLLLNMLNIIGICNMIQPEAQDCN